MSSWATSGSKQQSEAQIPFHLAAAELLDHSPDCFVNGSLLQGSVQLTDSNGEVPKALFTHHPLGSGKPTYSVLIQEATVAAAIIGVF